jgi:cyclopropane fatty-acyl-phospholipid synthase-like methyltransferase
VRIKAKYNGQKLMKKDAGSSQITRAYYDTSYYIRHADRLFKNDRFTRVKVKRVFDLLRPRPHEVILDLGSGVGTIMIALAKLQVRPIGLDYSKQSLNLAQEYFNNSNTGSSFWGVCCDSRDIGLKNESLDGIAAVDFTEHLDDAFLDLTLKEAYRVLRKGGRLIIYTPCRTHLFEILKRHNILLKEDKSHIGLRTMKEYQTILKQCGFKISDSCFAPTHIPVINTFETILMPLPLIGNLARRRICICSVK